MTDVPATVLMLGLCLLYIRLRSKKSEQSIIYLVSGVIIAITIMFRPVFAATVFPFFICAVTSRHWTSKFRNVAILVSPLVIAGASTMIYNAIEFGSPLRNGYHYWTPVPYDYMHLTFSLSYVPQNLAVLWKTNLFFLMISAILICAIDRWIVRSNQYGCSRLAPIRWISEFILLGVGPIVLFHQIYFFPSERFYLPILTLTATMVGSMLGAWLSRLPSSVMICMLILSLFWAVLIQSSETKLVPDRRLAIEEILRYTPEDAWIISGIEPAYLEYMVSQASQRRVVPISRRVEYAGKVIARKKNPAPAPPPQNWYDHRCAGLLYGGAQEAVTFVAAEKLDAIEKQKFHGTRVFINLAYIKREDQPILDELKERFHVVPVTKTLFELCK